jgi:ADP-ribosyl-[dinitrogen reductase] hydrolase
VTTTDSSLRPLDPARFRGCLLGLAAGDALGTTLEFKPPGSFTPITDMLGGGPFRLQPGQWTDDTSMALCLAESLIEQGGFDAADQMRRYLRWRDEGHLSSTGRCFDIGNTVGAALARFRQTQDPFAGSDHPRSAGNGSLMRLGPVPMRWAAEPATAVARAADSSRTTHAARTCIDACRYMAALIVGALHGEPKERLLAPRFSPVPGLWDRDPLCPEVAAVAAGSFRAKAPPAIRGTGYVVDALEAALWAFATTDSFAEGALAAVNLGDDADTTGAIYGQLAGAHHGIDGIPETWRECIAAAELILDFADRLGEGARGKGLGARG